jgi:hypothetical protein
MVNRSSTPALKPAQERATIGGTTCTYEEGCAAFEAEATIPTGATFNEAFILWLQERLDSSDDCLPGLSRRSPSGKESSLGSFELL